MRDSYYFFPRIDELAYIAPLAVLLLTSAFGHELLERKKYGERHSVLHLVKGIVFNKHIF